MHDVELYMICYLRDLLVTPAHADPDVTAFLSRWAFEEYVARRGARRRARRPRRPPGEARVGRCRSTRRPATVCGRWSRCSVSALVGERIVALYMTWGAG